MDLKDNNVYIVSNLGGNMVWVKTCKGSLLNLDHCELIYIKEINSFYRVTACLSKDDNSEYYLSEAFNTLQEAEVFLHELYEKIQ